MTKYSKNTLDFIRTVAGAVTSRPLAALLFINKQFPNNNLTYSLVLTSTTVGISDGTTTFSITYTSKTTRQVAQELSNSPFPIEVRSLANINSLSSGELKASGTVIPNGFDREDISIDGRSCVVRCMRYAVSYNKISSISIQSPYLEGSTLPWWCRITNGNFSQTYKGIIYHFSVPEYTGQTWSAQWGRPFVDVEGELANFVSKSVIKTNRSPLLHRNGNIVLTSVNGDRVYPGTIIKDVDTINGYIYLNQDVTLPKNVLIYYSYFEQSLLYKGVNLNGHFGQNPYVLDKYVVFYAKPTGSSSGIQRLQGIYHSIGTSLNDAIFNITNDNPNEPIAIIGAFNVKSSASLDDINITDTRSFGGGLRDDLVGTATEKKFKESQYFFDISNKEGIPYPGAAAVVVELPAELKEVASISEIRDRVTKFVAAGVYPIINFTEDKYFDRFAVTDLNTDISLVDYNLVYSNTGFDQEVFGLTGRVGSIIDTKQEIPQSGFYNSGYVISGFPNPEMNNGIIYINPGESYKLPYIKSSPDTIFSYEERYSDTTWVRKTVTNTRSIGTGQLSTQNLILESPYAYKEIRNITGFAPYLINQTFWDDISLATARVISMTKQLTSSSLFGYPITGYVDNVYTAHTTAEPTGVIGVKDLIEPLMVNYDICNEQNFFSGNAMTYLAAAIMYQGTTGNTFPYPYIYPGARFGTTPYSGTYNAIRDIHALARLSKHRTDDVISNNTSNVQSVNLTGSASWISTPPDAYYSWGFSGAFNIANKVISLSPFTGNNTIGSDIITPFYHPYNNVALPLTNTYGSSEIGTTNNIYYGSDYIKAFAALYASQVSPWSGDANYSVSLKTTYKPKNIALTGIINWVTYFENYFKSPTYNGTGVFMSWMTTFNRISDLGSRYLDNICNGIDYLYYGNKAWAGYTGYQAKRGTYYDVIYSPDVKLSGDTTWHNQIVWPDLTILTEEQTISRAITGINDSLALMDPYIRVAATHGGLMPPGYIKALKYYLWLPIHYANSDPMFTGISPDRNVETFEIGMAAAIKGSLNEDGIIIEGGSFNMKPAPFSGTVPSELFSACAKAIEYYTLVNDQVQLTKWQSIANGIQKTMDANYLHSGGYPYNIYSTTSSPGDPGSIPLHGLIEIIGQKPTPFSIEEFYNLTGQIPRYF